VLVAPSAPIDAIEVLANAINTLPALDAASLADMRASALLGLTKADLTKYADMGGVDLYRKVQRVLAGVEGIDGLPAAIRAEVLDAQTTARPIVLMNAIHRLGGMWAVLVDSRVIASAVGKPQLAVGFSGGVDAAVFSVQALLEADHTLGVLMADFKNAFNALARLAMLRTVCEKLPSWAAYCQGYLVEAARLTVVMRDGSQVVVSGAEGGGQGNPRMPPMFAMTIRAALEGFQQAVPAGCVLAILDDISVVGPPAALYAAYQYLQSPAFTGVGMHLNPSKCKVFTYGNRQQFVDAGNWGQVTVVAEDGVVLNGVPIGSDAYVTAYVDRYARVLCQLMRLLDELPTMHHRMALLRSCYIPRFDFLVRNVPPPLILAAATHYDNEVIACVARWLQVNGDVPLRARRLMQMPWRAGGLGIRPMARVCYEAFVSRVLTLASAGLHNRVPSVAHFLANLADDAAPPLCPLVGHVRAAWAHLAAQGVIVDGRPVQLAGGYHLAGVCHHSHPGMLGAAEEHHTDVDESIRSDVNNLPCGNPAHANGGGHGVGLGCLVGGAMAGAPQFLANDPATWAGADMVRLQRLLSYTRGAVEARAFFTWVDPQWSAQQLRWHRTHYLGLGGSFAAAWQRCLPMSKELTLTNAEFVAAYRMHIGLDPVGAATLPAHCVCAAHSPLAACAYAHLSHCSVGGTSHFRHNVVARMWARMLQSAGYQAVVLEELGHFIGPQGNQVNDLRADVSFTDEATGERVVCDAVISHPARFVGRDGPTRVGAECHTAIQTKNAKYLHLLGPNRRFIVLAHGTFGRFSADAARLLRQAARHARTISQVSTSLFLQGWSARISFALTKAVASTTLRRMHILQAHHAAANGVALPYGAADFLAPDGGGDGGNGGFGWGCGGGAG
jgi:hypothetical protein